MKNDKGKDTQKYTPIFITGATVTVKCEDKRTCGHIV